MRKEDIEKIYPGLNLGFKFDVIKNCAILKGRGIEAMNNNFSIGRIPLFNSFRNLLD